MRLVEFGVEVRPNDGKGMEVRGVVVTEDSECTE